MTPKPDSWIRRMALEHGMIEPFEDRQVRQGVISFGLSAYGYDLRVADEFQIFENRPGCVLDPKQLPADCFITRRGADCLIPPNGFALCRSLEYFRIPRNVIAITQGKSTYARCGLLVNVTPLEPEWEGHITISISNTAPAPVRIHSGEGLAQVVFLESDESCAVSYADKKGKYQAQRKITQAQVETA